MHRVRRDREPGAVIVCGGDPAIGGRADERLVGETHHDGVDIDASVPGRASATCRLDAMPDSGVGFRSDARTPPRIAAATRSSATTTMIGPALLARAASSACVTSGRPAKPSQLLGLAPTEALATARGEDDRLRSNGFQRAPNEHPSEVLAVLGRRVQVLRRFGAFGRVLGRVRRGRALRERLFDPRGARTAWNPCSPARRCVPPLTRVATAPTIAQSWARRLNFW